MTWEAFFRRCALGAMLGVALSSPAFASDAGAPADARVDDGGLEAGAEDPTAASLVVTTKEVRDLLAGKLAIAVPPTSLFEIPIDDDAAVALEAARLRALMNGLDTGAPTAKGKKTASSAAKSADAGAVTGAVPADVWTARIDLDRARLAFYELPSSRRRDLLAAHAKEQDTAPTLSSTDQRAADSEAQRQLALKAAREARTEAERLVATEQAHLLEVDHAQVLFDQALGKARGDLAARQEETLGWQRRVSDAIAGTPQDADRTYDELRHALRGSRDALSSALDDLSSPASGVPQPGPDALADLQIEIDTTAPSKEREHVVAEAARLGALETKLRADRTSALLIEIDTLNRERLGMLDSLSPEKRGAITGFTAAGLDQAASELRQLSLILRYHKHVIIRFVVSLRHPSRTIVGRTLFGSVLTLLEWIAVIGGFFWWRRRSPVLLSIWRKRVLDDDRHARLAVPSFAGRALGFVLQVHRPLESLLLLLMLTWLLPAEVHAILEVKVALTIVTWTVGAAFVVDAINALAGGTPVSGGAGIDIAKLRLRSLRLVARVVVVFGLILVISSMLVGHGTIYQWVFSTCWLASVPILLVLVQWWKNVVFLRLERVRKKTTFQQWVLAHSKGWMSFVAATAGGVHLFVSGTVRGVRTWVGKFDIYRKVLAYLFRREMDKLVADREPIVAAHLPDDTFLSLGPETPSEAWIRTDLEDDLKKLSARIASRKGGIIVIVGGRGMGKTRTLKKLHDDAPDVVQIQTPSGGLDAFRRAFAERTGGNEDATLEELASAFEASPAPAFFVDDIHRLVQPVMGGLAAFDELLAILSAHSEHTTWVLSLDSVLWLFLERSRGARPLFDEVVRLRPWREPEIIELLAARTAQAGVTPSFDGLLERLRANADEIDRREALEKRAADYYRLLWDHGGGNPGVVLHVWRRSLGLGPEGTVCVKLFQALDSSDLERLPDHTVFVLRAILQLAPADPEDIAKATMVRPAEVNDALRYGEARGYIAEQDGRYQVTWTWFRAVTLFLQRRHLLGS